ncbi:sigma-70 family RNA polymerase sigma factor [Curtobacterium sp. VKM Ac-2922]|uniref:sigma-70 family RNA polymerase sigma factor n=1 Tax=Curtobacterium sp. VKM Ac-2922 TaxID=2929475 RepID=UPI001FB491E7|nr:sigma-70 family RNA polymerase sigma factor [Curtobacterium sp. VKM Ac-2922]MCJ1715894.1 sigma-70 family RNA polymerase sigma factor [Curtobacterium sp. VKM Ac-2922]
MTIDRPALRAEECALLAAVGHGDRAAFTRVHERYRPLVQHWVRQYLADACVADEVVQDVFFELWTIADRFDPEQSAVAWIRTIAQRRAIDRLRKARADRDRDLRIGARDLELVDHAHVERAESVLDRRDLYRAVRALPDRQRDAVVLRYLVGMSGPETGERLGVSTATAKSRARDGILALRRVMTTASGTCP